MIYQILSTYFLINLIIIGVLMYLDKDGYDPNPDIVSFVMVLLFGIPLMIIVFITNFWDKFCKFCYWVDAKSIKYENIRVPNPFSRGKQ